VLILLLFAYRVDGIAVKKVASGYYYCQVDVELTRCIYQYKI